MDSAEQKVNTPIAKLPTKTLIAVLWLIVVGVALISFYFVYLLLSIGYSFDGGDEWSIRPFFILLLGSILYIISSIFLFRISKRAWIVAVTLLSIVTICSIGTYLYAVIYLGDDLSYMIPIALLLGSLIYLTPLILVILDRKNYFEMVRQREMEKKGK